MKTPKRYILPFLFLLLSQLANAQVLSKDSIPNLDSIPNQKLVNGSYISDRDNLLDSSTKWKIDSVLRSLEQRTSAQVAVVILKSIGIADEVEFSQNLFQKWGLGQKENDNGLLILFAKQQRIVRFHTGRGLEGVLPDVTCKRIQREYMVPEFKNQNYSGGLLAGVMEVDKILSDPNYAQEINQLVSSPSNEISDFTGLVIFFAFVFGTLWLIIFIVKAVNGHFADLKKAKHTDFPEMRLTRWEWLLQFVFIPIAIVAAFGISDLDPADAAALCFISIYLYFMLTLFHRLWRTRKVINRFLGEKNYSQIVEFLREQQWYWLFISFAFPPFLIYFFYHLTRKKVYRNHPRNCQQCQNKLVKLNNVEEDEYLTKSMLLEEEIKSVDYDVWKCQGCASIEVWHYLSNSSTYKPCPKCKTIAYYMSSDRTLVSATYTSRGKGERTEECKFCGHKKKSTYAIAQLVRSSSSSGSSFGGSSSSGGSSGGGSWGGGSSSGGGASSSW